MTIASSEQRPPEHRRFGMAVPHVPVPMILFAAAIAVALLVASRKTTGLLSRWLTSKARTRFSRK